MDKKTWIGVGICVAALIFQQQSVNKRMRSWRASEAERIAAEEAALPNTNPAINGDVAAAGDGSDSSIAAATAAGAPGTEATPAPAAPDVPEQTAVITTEGVEYVLTSNGGGIKEVRLLDHRPVGKEDGIIILNREGQAPVFAVGRGTRAPFLKPFEIVEQSASKVVMTGEIAPGVVAKKTFTPSSGENADKYLLDCDLQIQNTSGEPVELSDYFVYMGAASPLQKTEWILPAFFWNDDSDLERRDARKFSGSGFGPFKSAPTSEIVETMGQPTWAGTMNNYYSLLLRPKNPDEFGGSTQVWGRRFESTLGEELNFVRGDKSYPHGVHGGLGLGDKQLLPGFQIDRAYDLYAGPKEYTRLRGLGENRSKSMFYGFFYLISSFLMSLTTWIHKLPFVTNWGWAIVIMTIIIRTCIWPLHAKSQRTMKRMSLLQPKMAEMKEKYPDDPQKMQAETMRLYKDYGINPVGGCLPMFLQIPIFFGFYRMLQNAAELRHAHWLWVDDLSMPDTVAHIAGFPINPLPLLMGITMFLQMAISPKSGDKMQQRIFMLMPLMFLVFCYNFASGLALYWTGQNVFSIFQTWLMKRRPDPVLEKVGGGSGGGKPRKKPKGGFGNFQLPSGDDDDKKSKKRQPRTGG